MNIQISFQQKSFKKRTEDFLCARLDEDTETHLINNLRKLCKGDEKKILACDAKELLSPRLLFSFYLV